VGPCSVNVALRFIEETTQRLPEAIESGLHLRQLSEEPEGWFPPIWGLVGTSPDRPLVIPASSSPTLTDTGPGCRALTLAKRSLDLDLALRGKV